MAAPTIPGWQAQVLKGVGAPVTPQNLLFVNDWAKAEGGGATNNPFNTTQPAGGASSYNSVGVRNYGTPGQGIQATIQTLQNGRYGNILGELRQGDNAREAAAALANSPWGTGALVQKMLGGGQLSPAVPPVRPTAQAPGVPAPLLRQQLDTATLGILNQGASMFGLPPIPSSAPLRLPAPAAPPGPSPTAGPSTTPGYTQPKVKGPSLGYIEHQAAPFGLTVTSTTGGKHAENSYHYQGRAADFGGAPDKMAALAKYALSHAGQWTEFIYTGPGNPGYSILGGRVIPNSQLGKALYDEHTNHVHLAR